MPRALGLIAAGTPIVDAHGTILDFFRLRWQELRDGFSITPDVATPSFPSQHAALGTTSLYTTPAAGLYRVSYYLRKTVADGVSSSAQVTLGWTEGGLAQTETEPAVTTDAVTAQQALTKLLQCDGLVPLTIAVAYASNTPGQMHYSLYPCVERMA